MCNKKEVVMTDLERDLIILLQKADSIRPAINASITSARSIADNNKPSEDWLNEAEIFFSRYLLDHPLSSRMKTILSSRSSTAFEDMKSCLKSIQNDKAFFDDKHEIRKDMGLKNKVRSFPEYDVFVSHATADKSDIVDQLVNSLKKLGVNVFYDKESIEWGDKWKERIINGTTDAEFAIIVISDHFFGREWTERELKEFLNRQNKNGQKLILPILHNITGKDLSDKYPAVADIQAIDSNTYTTDEIALMFAKQLIRRLKSYE